MNASSSPPLNHHFNILPMKYIEPHGHMVSRTTDDYEKLALAGCEAICEPAFWAGFDRSSADGFYDYFRQLTEYEPKRAAKYGIKHYSLALHQPEGSRGSRIRPRSHAPHPGVPRLPDVLGIGEIGLNKNTRNELAIFEEHVQLALDHDLPILIHTPHLEDKLKGTRLILDRSPRSPSSTAARSSSTTSRSTPCPTCSTPATGPA